MDGDGQKETNGEQLLTKLGDLAENLARLESSLTVERDDSRFTEFLKAALGHVLAASEQLLSITRDLYELGERSARWRRLANVVFEAAPVPLCIIDAGGDVCRSNRAAMRILKLPDEATGHHVSECFARNVGTRLSRKLANFELREGPLTVDLEPGEIRKMPTRSARLKILPLDDIDSDDPRLLCTIELEEAIRSLDDERLQMLQRDATLGSMATNLTHEFNNLLGVISTWAELGVRQEDASESVREAFEKISETASRAAKLTDHILDFSRTREVEPHLLEANSLVEKNAVLLRPLLSGNVELRLELDAEVNPIWFDDTQLEQVLLNLVLNARDAIGGDGEITLSTEHLDLEEQDPILESVDHLSPGSYVDLCVADTGCGMDRETLQEAAEPFYTTKQEDETQRGTGLGLPMVCQLVEQGGGQIFIDTEPGGGTKVHVLLPRLSHCIADQQQSPHK